MSRNRDHLCTLINRLFRQADLITLSSLAALATLNAITLRGLTTFKNNAASGLQSLGSRQSSGPQSQPRVSVLVPARNEAKNLERLLPSLAAQDYQNLEILVLDDCSEDQTLEVAQRWATQDQRLRVLQGKSPPADWLGKPHACAQLAAQATGTILVFTDADTWWTPSGIRLIAEAFAQTQADVLSAWPEQRFSGMLSRLVQPIQQWSLIAFLPIPLVPKRNRLAVAANGQLLAFRREAYMSIGGHQHVKSSVIEDMALARIAKRHGLRFVLLEATGIVFCQMYANDNEMWRGLAKNIYPSLGASRLVLSALGLLFAWLYLKPWITLFSHRKPIAQHKVRKHNAAQHSAEQLKPEQLQATQYRTTQYRALFALLLGYWPRLLADLRFKAGPWLWWSHPLSLITWYALALSSKSDYETGRTTWKGRHYDLRNR